MARRLRHTPEGGALFDVTCRTVQSRFLLRPDPLLNEIIPGALARAKHRYGVELSAFIFLSNHLHILAWATDSKQLARFMGYFLSKLAREVSRLTGWRDKVFARRYQAIPISEEEAAQVARLVYILSNGCKEDLVERPQDWPGAHCVDALLSGQPLKGTWFDRTQEFAARNRGEPNLKLSLCALLREKGVTYFGLSEHACRSFSPTRGLSAGQRTSSLRPAHLA